MGFGFGAEEIWVDISLEQEGLCSVSLLQDMNSWHIVNLFLFAPLWGKGEQNFRKIKSLLTPRFLAASFSQNVKGQSSWPLGQSHT